MNSKWTHPVGYVGDAVYQAEIFTAGNTRVTVPKTYFQFGYDTSTIQKTKDIVLKIVFALRADTKERLWKVANESIEYRSIHNLREYSRQDVHLKIFRRRRPYPCRHPITRRLRDFLLIMPDSRVNTSGCIHI